MAHRYLHGPALPVMATVATAKAITSGQLVGMVSNTAVLPSDTVWDTDEATTRAAFVAAFLGVADQDKLATVARVFGNSEDNLMRVVTGPAEYEFDVESATYEIGDYLGPSKAAGNALLDTTLKKVTPVAGAVARVTKRGTTVTRVKAKLLSVLSPAAK